MELLGKGFHPTPPLIRRSRGILVPGAIHRTNVECLFPRARLPPVRLETPLGAAVPRVARIVGHRGVPVERRDDAAAAHDLEAEHRRLYYVETEMTGCRRSDRSTTEWMANLV